MNYIIEPMTAKDAVVISKWVYEGKYSFYSMEESCKTINELTGGLYYSVKDKNGLVGFLCFGEQAQIQEGNGYGLYVEPRYIDIGLGMRPGMCGQGLGLDFLLTGIKFAEKEFGSDKFRLTVADFNKRAIKVYERAGFVSVDTFVRDSDNVIFRVMKSN